MAISRLSEQEKIDLVREYLNSSLGYRKFHKKNEDRIGVSERSFWEWTKKYKHLAELAGGQLYDSHEVKGTSTLYDEEGNVRLQWIKTNKQIDDAKECLKEFAAGFSDEIPKAPAIKKSPNVTYKDLLSLYVITDAHIGMRSHDWNIEIAKKMIMAYIDLASQQSENSHTAVLVFQGDTAHFDSLEPVTPASKHVLDADCNARTMNRVIIGLVRYCIDILLKKHKHVHVIFAVGNHDQYTAVIQSEWIDVHYENEPRVSVDVTDELYHAYEWGHTSLFFHHGHKRSLRDVDRVFAGMFHGIFGRTKYRYGHIGHFHHDAKVNSQLMQVQIHPTLSGKDDYARHGGWLSNRAAYVITYSKKSGFQTKKSYTPNMLTSLL